MTARIVEASPVVHRLKRGLDLPLAGAPVQAVEPAGPTRLVGVLGDDWHGLKPTFQVQPGQRVRRGDLLFEDKTRPGVRHTSPAAGTVKAIHRGERRAFQSMVIECDDVGDDDEAQAPFASWRAATPAQWTAAEVRALLLESGLWTALRTRPFSQVPAADSSPYALYITAIDTRPHAPSVPMALQGREDDFALGVTMLAMLGNGRTRVCTGPDTRLALPALPGVQPEVFDGPHPAGLPGTHIHVLSPVDLERSVWHIGYQDVAAIGRLFASGRLDVSRVVSLAGPGVRRPRLLRTRLGVSLDELTRGELQPGAQRVISGSVLDGRTAMGDVHGHLGRLHLQVAVVAEAAERELFGWIRPGGEKFSVWGVVAGAWSGRPLAMNTTTHGGARAMVPIGSFEKVMPLDLMPTFLLRALLMGQDDRAEALGCLELDEDDLALCTFVCPGKAEYGPLLRQALTRIEKEAG